MSVELTVNGEAVQLEEGRDLATGLREAGYTEVKCGCDGGTCGISKVFVDGSLELACGMDVSEAAGTEVETVANLGTQSDLHPIQQAFVDHHAVQSGFSTGGHIMSAKALLDENPDPTEAEVRAAIDDVVDRETGYQKPVEAILDAAERMRDADAPADTGSNPRGDTNE
ncbi:MAG: (2Fe-2S)-binding protein [Halodesulfurarchaeum sp.]